MSKESSTDETSHPKYQFRSETVMTDELLNLLNSAFPEGNFKHQNMDKWMTNPMLLEWLVMETTQPQESSEPEPIKLIGTCAVTKRDENEWPFSPFYFCNFCISPAFQRQGYGRRMLDHLLTRFPEAHWTILITPDETTCYDLVRFYQTHPEVHFITPSIEMGEHVFLMKHAPLGLADPAFLEILEDQQDQENQEDLAVSPASPATSP